MAAQTNSIVRFGRMFEAQDSVTRPADTTAYTAGDAVSDNATTPTAAGYFALDFKGQAGGAFQLTDLTMHKSVANATNAAFDLLLFTTAPAFAGWEDNAAIAITDAEMLECKGVVRFVASGWTSVITGDIQTVTSQIVIVPTSASSTVYGILVASGAYTPTSGEILTITAHAVLN